MKHQHNTECSNKTHELLVHKPGIAYPKLRNKNCVYYDENISSENVKQIVLQANNVGLSTAIFKPHMFEIVRLVKQIALRCSYIFIMSSVHLLLFMALEICRSRKSLVYVLILVVEYLLLEHV